MIPGSITRGFTEADHTLVISAFTGPDNGKATHLLLPGSGGLAQRHHIK
jgi:hypothetical protein